MTDAHSSGADHDFGIINARHRGIDHDWPVGLFKYEGLHVSLLDVHDRAILRRRGDDGFEDRDIVDEVVA